MDSIAIEDMLDGGLMQAVSADGLAEFLAGDELCVLFFALANNVLIGWMVRRLDSPTCAQ